MRTVKAKQDIYTYSFMFVTFTLWYLLAFMETGYVLCTKLPNNDIRICFVSYVCKQPVSVKLRSEPNVQTVRWLLFVFNFV